MLESVQSQGAYLIIVSNAVEIVLFGVYSMLLAFALLILIPFKRPLPVNWTIVIAILVLFMLAMGRTSLTTTIRHTAFTSGFPLPTAHDMSGLIHRCWVVWDFNYGVVVAPLVLSVAAIVVGIVGILSLLAFLLITVLIALRLRNHPAISRTRSFETLLVSLSGACIETGALLVAVQLLLVIFLLVQNPGLLLVGSIASQIYGIGPTIMIIHLGLALIPRGRRRSFNQSTTVPQFSTLIIDTIYPFSEADELHIELEDAPSNGTRRGLSIRPVVANKTLRHRVADLETLSTGSDTTVRQSGFGASSPVRRPVSTGGTEAALRHRQPAKTDAR
ncbi:uncharacterized protein BXZ73DRAFT_105154 [Epithele typhae]|uniref:uncharacterized protein n=1 Tax=Epithele typhae TaxID=378194 RepID=UPI0020081A1B|nr:uncharacterized protein BXZ73DRAFT_105154 [Epithele typhae]KAH9918759.1 hypothetical protein BXZ73DRAFT_105154 [Epithele typhae]